MIAMVRRAARGAVLSAAVAMAGVAAAAAQPSAVVSATPPTAAELLRAAATAADHGDWATVVARATPVATDPRQRATDRAEAHRLLGLAGFALGRIDDADRAFLAYLRLDLDGHLDPTLYPPETIAYFESVRSRHAAELRGLRPRPVRTVLVNLLPPFGQFQNRQRTKGWIIAGLGGAMIAANVTTYALLKRWCSDQDGTCDSQGSSRREMADRALWVNRWSGVAAIGVYAYGVIDGFRHYRRRPMLVVTPPPVGDGVVLGVAGPF